MLEAAAAKSAADQSPSTQGALINEQDKRKGDSNSGSVSRQAAEQPWKKPGGSSGEILVAEVLALLGKSCARCCNLRPGGKTSRRVNSQHARLDPNSAEPTVTATRKVRPQGHNSCRRDKLSIREKEGELELPLLIDDERQLIASKHWRPDSADLGLIVAPHDNSAKTFANLLFQLAVFPAGSIRTLSLVGYARQTHV
jgi:hypothetical protein